MVAFPLSCLVRIKKFACSVAMTQLLQEIEDMVFEIGFGCSGHRVFGFKVRFLQISCRSRLGIKFVEVS